jgi:hypothetical protein
VALEVGGLFKLNTVRLIALERRMVSTLNLKCDLLLSNHAFDGSTFDPELESAWFQTFEPIK